MRSCIHVGFVGGNGNRRRRTKSAERRQPPETKTEKRISWNLNQRGEGVSSSPCAVQLSPSPDDRSCCLKTVQERRLPPPTPPNPYVLSPYFNYYEAGRLSPSQSPQQQQQQQQQYSRSTPVSPTSSRKLPATPIFEHTSLSPEYR